MDSLGDSVARLSIRDFTVPREMMYRGNPKRKWLVDTLTSLGHKPKSKATVGELLSDLQQCGVKWSAAAAAATAATADAVTTASPVMTVADAITDDVIGKGACGVIIGIDSETVEKKALSAKMEKVLFNEYTVMRNLSFSCGDIIPKVILSSYKDGCFRMERMTSHLSGSDDELIQIFNIIRRIHGEGYVIVDMKPDNFMIAADGRVKMIDFGLFERYLKYDKTHRPKQIKKNISGTPTYMSIHCMEKVIPSRRDDLETFVYVCEEFDVGLTWHSAKSDSEILEAKKIFRPAKTSLSRFLDIVRSLQYEEVPPYDDLLELLSS